MDEIAQSVLGPPSSTPKANKDSGTANPEQPEPGETPRMDQPSPRFVSSDLEAPSGCATQPVQFRAREEGVHWIERRAKLFEVGEYPDKGVTVTREHLAQLERSFGGPVPVLIEHADSPLELGYLTQVCASGDELYGVVTLTKEANALIERSGARSLSLGLTADLLEIREVSLVERPRIADAKLFSQGVRFEGKLMPIDAHQDTRPEGTCWKEEYDNLRRTIDCGEVERRVGEFVRAGKLLPCQAPLARVLLSHQGPMEFDGGRGSAAELFARLIELQPSHAMFGTLTEDQRREAADNLLLPEEAAFYRRHFPDIELDEIAKRKHGS